MAYAIPIPSFTLASWFPTECAILFDDEAELNEKSNLKAILETKLCK